MPHTYVAYVRISTTKQFLQGVSLDEQKRAITRYAADHHLNILNWYEEIESAAKGRRRVFREMMKLLKQRRYGLIMHKIDRGARSLRDWADIGDLIDAGIDVRFAHDNLDMDTRGGRLTADIQAVIAADYIRNLREEVRKGIEGRLHQGLYPFRAPRGYLDRGNGKAKMPDPVYAPLIVEAFRRYATGGYTLRKLAEELSILGLTKPNGKPVTAFSLAKTLRCSFYVGEMFVRGKRHIGKHQPLVSRDLFNAVQRILGKRKNRRGATRRSFLYRLKLRCKQCGYHLYGEGVKTYIYYRCHYCPRRIVREDRVPALAATPDAFFELTSPIESTPIAYSEFDSL